MREALAVAREAGIPTVVDLDVPPSDSLPGLGSEAELLDVLRGASLLKPSKTAAREIAPEAAADALALARTVRARFGNEAVVVTDGEAGCAIVAEGFEGLVPAVAARALDTTGAGDAFLGGLLAGLHYGLAWEDAGRLGNACGAACVEKLGAFPDDAAAARARVLELYAGPPLSLAALPPAIRRAAEASGDGGEEALAVFGVAVEEMTALRDRLTPEVFDGAIDLIRRSEADPFGQHSQFTVSGEML